MSVMVDNEEQVSRDVSEAGSSAQSEASVDYYYTEVDCPEVVYEFVLCDPYGEIYRDECLTSPPREMFLSHCYTTHFCYTYDQGQL